MGENAVMELPALRLPLSAQLLSGANILGAFLDLALNALEHARRSGQPRIAAVGRLRGTGRGVHFRELVERLERDHPIRLESPFEDSQLVAGAAWDGQMILGPGTEAALAKLRWSAGADDLPMHVHEHSDRFIIVHEGRGYFHVSDQTVDEFDGRQVRTIPARERDVFLFTRGVVHTFSTADQPMTLLSCQLPYLPFDDPRQYKLPRHIWTARANPERHPVTVACDPAWSLLLGNVPGR